MKVGLHEKTGLLGGNENPDSLDEGIHTILDKKDLSLRLGKAGRKRTVQLFDIKTTAADMLINTIKNKSHYQKKRT